MAANGETQGGPALLEAYDGKASWEWNRLLLDKSPAERRLGLHSTQLASLPRGLGAPGPAWPGPGQSMVSTPLRLCAKTGQSPGVSGAGEVQGPPHLRPQPANLPAHSLSRQAR